MFGNKLVSVPSKIDWSKTYKAKPVGFLLTNGGSKPVIKWKIYSGKDRTSKLKKGKGTKRGKSAKA